MKKIMTKEDWIILRLTMQIEILDKGLDGDAVKAAEFLIQKYNCKTIKNCMKAIKNELDYKSYCFFKLAEDYLQSKGKLK